MQNTKKWKAGSAIIVVVMVAVLSIFDVFALLFGGVDATISQVMYQAAREWPIIALAIGALMGHLFWPQKKIEPPKGELLAKPVKCPHCGKDMQK